MLARKTRVHNRDRLFCVGIVHREIAAFQNLQPECRKIVIGYGFKVSAGPIAVGKVILTVNFVLAAAGKRHSEPIT